MRIPHVPVQAVRTRLGRFHRRLVQRMDHQLHARRHQRIMTACTAGPAPRRILVLCHGNICRSPYFAAALRREVAGLQSRIDVDSAGFVGPGRPVPEESRLASAGRNVSLDHCSKLVTRDMVEASDLVIVMDSVQASRVLTELGGREGQVVIAGDLDPLHGEPRVIRDPWKESVDVFSATFDRIDRCVGALVDAISESDSSVLSTR